MLKRYLEPQIIKDLERKMVFLSGPRQAGKTTIAREMLKSRYDSAEGKKRYLNWDDSSDRELIFRGASPFAPGLVVFDELHKYARWRQYLKGLYDKRRDELNILVTGSARLDYYRRGGDSLQGRYHHLRLHPLSLREVHPYAGDAFADLLELGGIDRELRYFRDVEGREVDFVVLEEKRPIRFVECKLSGRDASPSLRYLRHKFPAVPAIQVEASADFDIMTKDGIRICAAARFLSELAA